MQIDKLCTYPRKRDDSYKYVYHLQTYRHSQEGIVDYVLGRYTLGLSPGKKVASIERSSRTVGFFLPLLLRIKNLTNKFL